MRSFLKTERNAEARDSASGCVTGCKTIPDTATILDVDIAKAYGNAKAIVTIISDDGFYASGVILDKIFGERNLQCTVGGAVRIIRPYLYKWKKLVSKGTIDLVNHSYNHIRMEDGSKIADNVHALKHEILDADKFFQKKFGTKQIAFVCPENQMCESGYKIISKSGFWAVRRGERGLNNLSPIEGIDRGQWFNLMCYGIRDEGVTVTTEIRNGWIDSAIQEKSWLIEMWHNVAERDDGGYQTILIPEACEHLDYIRHKVDSKEVWVATFTEAVKYIREKQNVNIGAYIDDNKMYVYCKLIRDEMSTEVFHQPLTINIKLPENSSIIPSENVNLVEMNGLRFLVTDIVPEQTVEITLKEK